MTLHTPPIRIHTTHLPFGDIKTAPLYQKDILAVNQFRRSELEAIFEVAHEMEEMVRRIGTFDLLKGKILASVFYEPSTRTSASFTAAMERLGGSVIPINEVTYSSVSKGESLPDTVRTLEAYADVIVLRHPEVGSAALAAKYASKPVINAGDGIGEHPTQALLDLHTIREEMARVDGLTITMVGDLKYGRVLSRFEVKLNYVSPEILPFPQAIVDEIDEKGIPQHLYSDLESVIGETDVLYVTRVQKERFADVSDYEKVKDAFVVDAALMEKAQDEMIVMHPLPRVGEISMEVDDDPRAAYFRQVEYGLYVRMALLAMVVGKA